MLQQTPVNSSTSLDAWAVLMQISSTKPGDAKSRSIKAKLAQQLDSLFAGLATEDAWAPDTVDIISGLARWHN